MNNKFIVVSISLGTLLITCPGFSKEKIETLAAPLTLKLRLLVTD